MRREVTEQELRSIRQDLESSLPLGSSPGISAQVVLRLLGIKPDEVDKDTLERMTRTAMVELDRVQDGPYPITAAQNAWIDRWILAPPAGDGLLDDRLLRKALTFLLAKTRRIERQLQRRAERFKVVRVEFDYEHARRLAVIKAEHRFETDQEAIRALVKEAALRISNSR